MCFHLRANCRFVGRLQVDDALGIHDRGAVVRALRGFFGQAHESRMCLSAKFRSLIQDPVLISSWKKIARIETCSELEVAGRDCVVGISTHR